MGRFVHPISQLVHCTVRITCFDALGKESYGSGYFFKFCEENGTHVTCIVTNKHVLEGAVSGVFNLTLRKADGTPDIGRHESLRLDGVIGFSVPHPDPHVDLIAIPVGMVLESAERKGFNFYFLTLDYEITANAALLKTLAPMEDVVMIGYPIGLWDKVNNYPIIRKGITATHPSLSLNGKPEFLIDAACFPGSSGSPVFLANIGSYLDKDGTTFVGNRISLLGTLYAGPQQQTTGKIVVVDVPTDTRPVAIGGIPTNLGYVINTGELKVLEEAVRKFVDFTPRTRNSTCPCGSGKRFKNCCGVI